MGTLFEARSRDEIIACLQRGDDINQSDECDGTPFIYHCRNNNIEAVITLIENGCDVNTKFRSTNALYYVCTEGHSILLKNMLKYQSIQSLINSKTDDHSLTYTCWKGHSDVYDILLEAGANVNFRDIGGNVPLNSASTYCHLDIVIKLLRDGADPDIENNLGNTPIFYCGNKDILLHILTYGGEVNHKNCKGFTALNWYMYDRPDDMNDFVNIIETLLKFGADPNIFDNKGTTPLLRLLKSSKTYTLIVKLLLKYGADPNISDINGITPLMRSLDTRNITIANLLLEHGANPNIKDNDQISSLDRIADLTSRQKRKIRVIK